MTVTVSKTPRKLGNSNLTVFPIGLGCMSLSGAYGKGDDTESIKVVHHAIDNGVNFLDSSDMYGWGHNETLLGKALTGGRRDKVVLATKFGQTQQPGGANGVNGRPEYVKQACEASLQRLGVDEIDLYYQHRVDPSVPIEETVGAMGELVKQGKVRAIGLCEAKPETIRRAHKTHPLAAVQSEYSLLYRQHAEETLATTRPLGIAYVAYSPLGRSLLTGSVKSAADIPEGDGRGRHPRFAGDNLARNLQLAAAIEAMAKAKGCTACHDLKKKLVGPAYADVAKKYKGDAKAPEVLSAKVVKGGQGVWGPIPMPPNDKVTPDEAKKLVAWVLSL